MSESHVRVLPLQSIDAIRDHVRKVLCEHDRLDEAQVELCQAEVVRQGRPCGMMFQVRGPRRLRTYAVWAGHEDRILFYSSTGSRFAETRVIDGPAPTELKAQHAA